MSSLGWCPHKVGVNIKWEQCGVYWINDRLYYHWQLVNKKACPLLDEGKISHRLGHYPIQVACQGSTRYQAQGVL